MMRAFVALLLTATPALAHPGAAVHLHEADGFWIAGLAFAIGVALSSVAVVQAVKARK